MAGGSDVDDTYRLHCKLEFMDGAFSGLAPRTFPLSESQGTEDRNSKPCHCNLYIQNESRNCQT